MTKTQKWIFVGISALALVVVAIIYHGTNGGLVGALGGLLGGLSTLIFGRPEPSQPTQKQEEKAQEVAQDVKEKIDSAPPTVVVQQYGGDSADQQRTSDVAGIVAGLEATHTDAGGTPGGT